MAGSLLRHFHLRRAIQMFMSNHICFKIIWRQLDDHAKYCLLVRLCWMVEVYLVWLLLFQSLFFIPLELSIMSQILNSRALLTFYWILSYFALQVPSERLIVPCTRFAIHQYVICQSNYTWGVLKAFMNFSLKFAQEDYPGGCILRFSRIDHFPYPSKTSLLSDINLPMIQGDRSGFDITLVWN